MHVNFVPALAEVHVRRLPRYITARSLIAQFVFDLLLERVHKFGSLKTAT
jgi:hypothetical protein